jgi:exopolysaccharide biosynthesis polyprenyl glycosylphosphotransferase
MSLPVPTPQSSMAAPPIGTDPTVDVTIGGASPAVPAEVTIPPGISGSAQRLSPSPRARSAPRRPRLTPEAKLQRRLFRVSDAVVVLSVLLLVFIATNIGDMPGGTRDFLALRITVKNLLLLVGFVTAWRGLCLVTGLYDRTDIGNRRREVRRVTLTCALASAVALAFPTISVTGAFQYSAVFYFWIGSSLGILVLRGVLRNLIRALVPRSQPGITRDALIVGAGPRGQRLYHELAATRSADYNIVGFVDSADQAPSGAHGGKTLGRLEDLEDILMRNAIDEVLIALPIKSQYTEIQRVMQICERVGVRAKYLADLFENSGCVSEVEGDQVSLVATPRTPEGWRLVTKRAIDLAGASAGLVLLSPVLLIAALAIKLSSPGPVLFTQPRYGLNRRLFKMYKLRTMVADADALQADLEARNEATGPVFKIQHDPRVTPVGRWLRRSSLDEFPQLLNVLHGEMSLVGPRPLPVRDVHRFTEAALMRRFSVRPGVTCLWQISGRSTLTFEDWIRLDLQYIDEWSMRLDVWVLIRTIPAVLKGTGAS